MRIATRALWIGICLLAVGQLAAAAESGCKPKDIANPAEGNPSSIGDIFFWLTTAPASSTTWGFANTSGTSGCGGESQSAGLARLRFIAANGDVLAGDMAQGRGEHVQALATLYGCSTKAGGRFASAMQAGFEHIVPRDTRAAGQWLRNIDAQVRADASLAEDCPAS